MESHVSVLQIQKKNLACVWALSPSTHFLLYFHPLSVCSTEPWRPLPQVLCSPDVRTSRVSRTLRRDCIPATSPKDEITTKPSLVISQTPICFQRAILKYSLYLDGFYGGLLTRNSAHPSYRKPLPLALQHLQEPIESCLRHYYANHKCLLVKSGNRKVLLDRELDCSPKQRVCGSMFLCDSR